MTKTRPESDSIGTLEVPANAYYGVQTLRGCEVRACDLRAGAAMVIAAMCAEGMTLIEDAHFIERGYEDIVGKLTALGAHIRRIETYETPSVSEDAG